MSKRDKKTIANQPETSDTSENKIPLNIRIRIWLSNTTIQVAIIGALALIVAAFIQKTPNINDNHGASSIVIAFPRDGDMVDRTISLNGSFANLPPYTQIWVYVYAEKQERYYTDKATTFNVLGIWLAQSVVIGTIDDTNAYRIGVLLVEPDAAKDLKSNPDNRESLPAGVQVFDEITIVRR